MVRMAWPRGRPLRMYRSGSSARPELTVDGVGEETAEELIRRYRETGDRRFRTRVVEQHEWLARAVARQLKRSGEEFDDLVQVAMIGILKAIERFEPGFGASFRTYASVTARGEVRRHYRDAGWSVSVPRRLKDLRYDVAAATEVLRERLRRAPTTSEVASYLRISRDEVETCIAAGSNFRALPIDLPTGAERSSANLRDSNWEERIVAHLDANNELVELLEKLPVRLRNVLVMRFVEERKQTDIAGEIGVSQVHVSRLIKQALVALRELADRRVVGS